MNSKGKVITVLGLGTLAVVVLSKLTQAAAPHRFRVGDIIALEGNPVNAHLKITAYTPGPSPLYGSYTILVLTGWDTGGTRVLPVATVDLSYEKII